MKLILVIALIFIVYPHSTALCVEKSVLLEIEQINIITGKAVKYTFINGKIKIYKGRKENRYCLVTTNKITTEKAESINRNILQLTDSYGVRDTIFSNPIVLDGFAWFVTISTDGKSKTLKVYNCYHSQLDNIILLINEEIKKKKRLIFPTGRLYMNSKCE